MLARCLGDRLPGFNLTDDLEFEITGELATLFERDVVWPP